MFIYLERLPTQTSKLHRYLKLNIAETVQDTDIVTIEY